MTDMFCIGHPSRKLWLILKVYQKVASKGDKEFPSIKNTANGFPNRDVSFSRAQGKKPALFKVSCRATR